jgi:hypothetical protein
MWRVISIWLALSISAHSKTTFGKTKTNLLDRLSDSSYEIVHLHHTHHDKMEDQGLFKPKKHPSTTSFRGQALGLGFEVELQQHLSLVSLNYEQIREGADGERVTKRYEDIEHCHYKANDVHGRQVAAVNICQGGFQGTFKHETEGMLTVSPAKHHLSQKELEHHVTRVKATTTCSENCSPVTHQSLHVVYRRKDFKPAQEFFCDVGEEGDHDHGHDHAHGSHAHLPNAKDDVQDYVADMLGGMRIKEHPGQRKLQQLETFDSSFV